MNRLAELLGSEAGDSPASKDPESGSPELGSRGERIPSGDFDPAFMELKGETESYLKKLQADLTEVENLASTLDSCTTAADEAAVLQRYEEALSRCSQALQLAKASLDAMGRSNLDFEAANEEEKPAECSFRRAVHGTFGRELNALLMKLETLRKRFEQLAAKKQSTRKMVFGRPSGGSDGADANGANASQTTRAHDSQAVSFADGEQAAYFEIDYQENDRLQDLQRIENTMRDIRSIFVSLSETIDKQGQVVDSIEFSVVNAKNYTHKAQVQLINARKKQRRRTAAYCCCYVTCAICVAVLILMLLKNFGVLQ